MSRGTGNPHKLGSLANTPVLVYEFSKSRARDGPLTFLNDYRGDLQADADPRCDSLYLSGKITEVACNAHARRRLVEATDLLKGPGRPMKPSSPARRYSASSGSSKTSWMRSGAGRDRSGPSRTKSSTRRGSTTPCTWCCRRTAGTKRCTAFLIH